MKLHELQDIKSPSHAKIITYFETGQGSKYVFSASGESKRWKSSHANTGGEDQGAKTWYEKCIFVPDKFHYEGNSVQFLTNRFRLSEIALSLKGNKAAFYVRKNNKWEIATWDDAYPKSKKGPIPLTFEFSEKPIVGYSCLEFTNGPNHALKNFHFGSEVTKVLPIEKADQSDIDKVMSTA